MLKNENLKKLNYYHQETKSLFIQERANAKKHLYYAQLRLKFLEWLERGYLDELVWKLETEAYDPKNLEETMAWQEAVLMLGDELRDDGFYIDITGNINNYSLTWSYHTPLTDAEKTEHRKLIKEKMAERQSKLDYTERKKLDVFFHSLMNMKPKEEVIFHDKYDAFQAMIKENSAKGDSYVKVIAKLSKPSKKLKGKSALECFLNN